MTIPRREMTCRRCFKTDKEVQFNNKTYRGATSSVCSSCKPKPTNTVYIRPR